MRMASEGCFSQRFLPAQWDSEHLDVSPIESLPMQICGSDLPIELWILNLDLIFQAFSWIRHIFGVDGDELGGEEDLGECDRQYIRVIFSFSDVIFSY